MILLLQPLQQAMGLFNPFNRPQATSIPSTIWSFPPKPLSLPRKHETDEGNGAVPFFISQKMATEEKTVQVKALAEKLLESEPQYFLVRVNVRPINNISVYVDGDEGVTIEKCVKLNRALYKEIVEKEICKDGEFGLEVSSPGIDEPLLLQRQYIKNIGRVVEVEMKDGRAFEGKLLAADEKGIEVDEEKGKGKKMEVIKHVLIFDDIKTTTVKIVF
jgi:ribosome maturation factor RimP